MRPILTIRSRLLGCIGLALAVFAAACSSGGSSQNQRPVEQSVANDPDPRAQAKAHTELAGAYFGLGNVAVALDEVRIAIASDPTYAPAHNVQGLVHMELRENPQAQASFQRALSLAPDDPDVNHNYGWFLCQTGRTEQGLTYFNNAIKNPLYRSPSKSNAQAGMCMLNAKNETEAIRYFDRALKIEPDYTPVMLPYATLLYSRGEFDASRRFVQRYNELRDPSAESLWLALRIERRRGDQAGVASLGAQLRRRYPASREAQALAQERFE